MIRNSKCNSPSTAIQLTRTIFVSSNSCCILIIVSACFGSWYFDTYVWISGKLIAEGWLNDDWGTLPIKSSRTLVRMENAGRTGYSWSVITTAESLISISTQKAEIITLTSQLFCSTPIIHMCHVIVLLYTLSLSLWRPLCDSSGQKSHEFPYRAFLVKRKLRQIGGCREDCRW